MPAILSHWLLGKRVFPELKTRSDIAGVNENCFLWGCQGPDVLFFQRLLPWKRGQKVSEYGGKLHDGSPSRIFCALAELLDVCDHKDYDMILSYSLGMCCHYSFDRTAHPYINWLSARMSETDERGPDFKYHGEVESALDIIFLRNETGLLPSDLKLTDAIPDDDGVTRIIALIYTKLLYRIFGVRLEPKYALLMTKDMRDCFAVLDDRTLLKKPVIELIERVVEGKPHRGGMSAYMRSLTEGLDYDYANLTHQEWHNICAPERGGSQSFLELADLAAEDTMLMIDHFLCALKGVGSFENYTEERSFSNDVNELLLHK